MLKLGLGLGLGTSSPKVELPIGRAQTGDIVFGAQADTGSLVGGFLTPGANNKALCATTYLPSLPAGWRMMFWNFDCISNGAQPIERTPGNLNDMKWISIMNGVAGTRIVGGDATFNDFHGGSGVIQDGGFLITDQLPVVPDGYYARWVLDTPASGRRTQTYGQNYNARGQNAGASSTAAAFDPIRAGGALTGGNGNVFNLEGTQAAGLLIPMPASYRSFLMIGTSIMRSQSSSTRYLLSVDAARNVYGYLPIGLDSATNGRMGWAQMAVNGASIATQSSKSMGSFGYRYAGFKAIADKNGGRWPFTDIILDFRNDAIQAENLPDVAATVSDMQFRIMSGLANIKAMFPGIPAHVVTLPTMQILEGNNYWTSLAGQVASNFKAEAVVFVNSWLKANFVSLGFASVCDIASDMVTVDGGVAKWSITPFNIAGAGALTAQLPIGTNLSTTGFQVDCPSGPPEVGTFPVFEPDVANSELIPNAGPIVSVAPVIGSTYLVKVAGGTLTTKLHAASSVVKTTNTGDGTHPEKYMQDRTGQTSVVAWKATV